MRIGVVQYTSLGNMKCLRTKHACLSLRIPRPLHNHLVQQLEHSTEVIQSRVAPCIVVIVCAIFSPEERLKYTQVARLGGTTHRPVGG